MLKQSLIVAGTIGWVAVAAISSGIDRTSANKTKPVSKATPRVSQETRANEKPSTPDP